MPQGGHVLGQDQEAKAVGDVVEVEAEGQPGSPDLIWWVITHMWYPF